MDPMQSLVPRLALPGHKPIPPEQSRHSLTVVGNASTLLYTSFPYRIHFLAFIHLRNSPIDVIAILQVTDKMKPYSSPSPAPLPFVVLTLQEVKASCRSFHCWSLVPFLEGSLQKCPSLVLIPLGPDLFKKSLVGFVRH